MRRYKKLPLDSPFIYEKDYWEECVKKENKITPRFNSNGYYLDRYTGDTNTEEEYCLDGALGDFDEGEQFIRCDLIQ